MSAQARLRELPPLELAKAGQRMHAWIRELYPICRSITGPGLRQTLAWIKERLPLTIHSVPSGTQVLDWEAPDEWTIRDAYVRGPDGAKVIDFQQLNLHVINYSTPVRETLPLAVLQEHLHSLPAQPDLVPYRTSYYRRQWGFCLTQRVRDALPNGEYEVCIDATLGPGELNYGELVLPGETDEEVLLSCHVCHPALANDNLSGLAVAVSLAELLSNARRRYTYRFLFAPGTIGSITWLARNRETIGRVRHGLVLACLGDPGHMHYKRSRQGAAEIDRAVQHVLEMRGGPYQVRDFVPYGYDERQYCAPGFDLAVGALSRTPHGEFPEYHTSGDNPDFLRPEALADSLDCLRTIIEVLEENRLYRNLSPYGEPQLGKRGLYRGTGGENIAKQHELALLWVLNQSDGTRSLLDIAERAKTPFDVIRRAAEALERAGLVECRIQN